MSRLKELKHAKGTTTLYDGFSSLVNRKTGAVLSTNAEGNTVAKIAVNSMADNSGRPQR